MRSLPPKYQLVKWQVQVQVEHRGRQQVQVVHTYRVAVEQRVVHTYRVAVEQQVHSLHMKAEQPLSVQSMECLQMQNISHPHLCPSLG